MKKQNGITLISLIITIIIMLILAGVSLSMVMGDGSILDQANAATEKTRAGEVKEQVDLAKSSNKMIKYSNVGTVKTKEAIVQELYSNNQITDEEKNKLLGENGETEVDIITIADIVIDFSGMNDSVTNTNYTVEFKNEDGSVTYSTITVAAGETPTKPTDPTKDSYYDPSGMTYTYSFAYWVSAPNSTTKVEVETTPINANTVYYAHFYTNAVCFVAGTKVLTDDGLRNIENIKVGDMVYSINVDTNQRELKEVQDVFTSTTKELYEVTVNGKVIETTPRHQFYVVDRGWVRAYDLVVGDVLVTKDNTEFTIDKLELVNYEDEIPVYNFKVEGNHNYLITEFEVLVHNAGSPS